MALGLTGWVQNQNDGTVAALLQGEAGAVQQMVARMHDGPPDARVEQVAEQACEAKTVTGFRRL
ncbi:acylphosphatase [Croceibacterium ferulae]|uniref:acylphosphatase n=1 Tax=Croceibacterium ferulae TaxID=1854641 RepID=UPI0030C863BE